MLCAALAAGFAGCSYDDDDLWNEVDSLRQEQEALKQDIARLKSSVAEGAVVTKVEPTETGYKLTLSDGKSYELKKDGDDLLESLVVDGDKVVVTLASGEVLELPMLVGTLLTFPEKSLTLRAGETREVAYKAEGIETLVINSYPKGYELVLDEAAKTLRITAPKGSDALGEGDDRLVLLGADAGGRTLLAALTLRFNPLPAEGGVMVYNEGSFGRDPASVSIYYDGSWSHFAYQRQNTTAEEGIKTLGATGTMVARYGERFYFVAKGAPCVVEASSDDLTFRSELSSEMFGQGCSIAIYDDTKAYFSGTNGLFEVGIDPLTEGKQVFASRNGGGDVAIAGGKVYFIDSKTLYLYDPATGAEPTELGKAQTGFAELDGALWCGNATTLTKIDPATATVQTFTLDNNFPLYANTMAYTPSQIAAGNGRIYYLTGTGWSSNQVCQYDPAAGTSELFWTIPDGYASYGSGLSFDTKQNQLYVTYVENGWGDHYKVNYVAALNASGSVNETIDHTGYFWFPSKIYAL